MRVVNDPQFDAFGFGPHDARVLPDGTLTLHDNGAENSNAPDRELNRPPRALRYRIDPESRTATLIEEVKDPRVPHATCCGSARKLKRGNWVMSWGRNSLITELTPAGAPVFSLSFDANLFSYRADPVPFGTLRRRDLREGMDAQYRRPAG